MFGIKKSAPQSEFNIYPPPSRSMLQKLSSLFRGRKISDSYDFDEAWKKSSSYDSTIGIQYHPDISEREIGFITRLKQAFLYCVGLGQRSESDNDNAQALEDFIEQTADSWSASIPEDDALQDMAKRLAPEQREAMEEADLDYLLSYEETTQDDLNANLKTKKGNSYLKRWSSEGDKMWMKESDSLEEIYSPNSEASSWDDLTYNYEESDDIGNNLAHAQSSDLPSSETSSLNGEDLAPIDNYLEENSKISNARVMSRNDHEFIYDDSLSYDDLTYGYEEFDGIGNNLAHAQSSDLPSSETSSLNGENFVSADDYIKEGPRVSNAKVASQNAYKLAHTDPLSSSSWNELLDEHHLADFTSKELNNIRNNQVYASSDFSSIDLNSSTDSIPQQKTSRFKNIFLRIMKWLFGRK